MLFFSELNDAGLRNLRRLLDHMEQMEAAVLAAGRLARWYKYGHDDQPWGSVKARRAMELKEADESTLKAATSALAERELH